MLIALFLKKSKKVLLPIYSFVLLPFILLAHSVIPFTRTWIYLVIPFVYLIGLFLEEYQLYPKWSNVKLAVLAFMIMAGLTFNFRNRLMKHEEVSFISEEIADYLIRKKTEGLYCNRHMIGTNLDYIFDEKNKNIEVVGSNHKIDSLEASIISKKYD